MCTLSQSRQLKSQSRQLILSQSRQLYLSHGKLNVHFISVMPTQLIRLQRCLRRHSKDASGSVLRATLQWFGILTFR